MVHRWSANELLRTSNSYWRSCTLQAGVRLDLFTLLDGGWHALQELADQLSADRRGLAYLLNALTAMGLLEKRNERYSDSDAAAQLLSSKSPANIRHILLHHHDLLDCW